MPDGHPRKQTLRINSQSLQQAAPSAVKAEWSFLHISALTCRVYNCFNCCHSCVY